MKKEAASEENNSPEATTLNGPAPYEEELQDFSKTGEDADNNNPITHPEPSPTGTK